jgi:hypothetical protein
MHNVVATDPKMLPKSVSNNGSLSFSGATNYLTNPSLLSLYSSVLNVTYKNSLIYYLQKRNCYKFTKRECKKRIEFITPCDR